MAQAGIRGVARAAAGIWSAWRRLIQSLLGEWQWHAPPWGLKAAASARLVGGRLALRSRRNPWGTAALAAAGALLVASSIGAWRWYQHRPQPELAGFSVTAPGRTRIEVENAKPEPLIVRFDRSASALALAGKEVGDGIGIEPSLPGTWRWLNDRTLEFRVKEDWPIGQTYRVKFERRIFGPQIRLADYGFTFASAPFEARLTNAELYQDPVNPGIKQAVFDVQFTHPVDPAEFERRIELKLAGQSPGVLGVGRETTAFSVVYDKLKLNASIHSSTLPVPKDPTNLELSIAAGLVAARGGGAWPGTLTGKVAVPGLYSLSTLSVEPLVVDDERNEAEQVLMLSLSATTGERDVARAVSARLLPTVRPADGRSPAAGSDDEPYDWFDVGQVTAEVAAAAPVLTLEPVPAEHEFVANHSFRYHADVGRYLLVQVEKNLRSFGGYLSPKTERFIVRVPPFPPQLQILSRGSLLTLSGEHKVVALVRDLPGMRVDLGRVLPEQLQHLISQADGDFSNPVFNGRFGADNLVERFERKVPLATLAHGQTHYEPIDLGAYLNAPDKAGGLSGRRGLFLLTIRGYDPRAEDRERQAEQRAAALAREPGAAAADPGDATESDEASEDGSDTAPNPDALSDSRLVLVTDLGIIVKKSPDGTQDVFVQSIQSGAPVAGAVVDIVAKNGTTLYSQTTDAAGRAHFPGLTGLAHERAPLFVQVRKAGDMSFLPLNRSDRALDYSRFDVGGIRNARNANEVSAYLFSDRGLYRPGETLHIGMITRAADWSTNLAGIPLEYDLLDARGLTVKRERFNLPAGGFSEFDYATPDIAPTGAYTANLYIVKDGHPGDLIGATTVRVQQFEQDRMKVAAHLSSESAEGWVSPKDLRALINVQNLFGTPAANRRVAATMTLTPAYPAFRSLPDYRFYDPLRAKEGYSEELKDTVTDLKGDATLDLGLQKYARATYRVHVLARAFEPDGGRMVAADTGVLVSELPFLVGFKADGDLGYVSRDAKRSVSLIAIDPSAHRTQASNLTLTRIETQFVSVLTKQTNGTYKYESRKKETTLKEEPLAIPAAGMELPLAADTPGTFAYLIRDSSGLELNRVEYTVAGRGNVTRSLERNAELQITLDKKDYAPGEDIELNIKGPYTGAGLITIERDRVYATQWFKSDTTASVQKIHLPSDFEGNGYVTVEFIRDPGSDEIFTSPLSYGVAPFATSLAKRTNALSLSAPELIKPGDVLHVGLGASQATRAVVFAVDEGILQVARYQTPDPLGQFFKKRSLEVRTSQILDLILPEFKRIMEAAAPGGDGDAALRRNLNPFKRKRDKPAVYWSGIVDVKDRRDFTWTVPDTFNGSLRIFAIAVNDATIGVAQGTTLVRGDFVLTPNMPVAVAPGDEFEVSVGVANNLPGGAADIRVSAATPPELESLDAAPQTIRLESLREGVAIFRFRARRSLGAARVVFSAAAAGHAASLASEVSVRPASPYVTDVVAGYFDSRADLPLSRVLHPNFRKLHLAVSTLPLVLTGGLIDYLDDYPHLCTEQLLSRGFPALVLARRPELADSNPPPQGPGGVRSPAAGQAPQAVQALIGVLRSRQNAEGGFGLWAASVQTSEFASVYAVHWMMEARERGETVPDDLYQRGLSWLQQFASSGVADDDPSGIDAFRNRAYAAYLLTRQGRVTTPVVAGLRERLDARFAHQWQEDATAAYLASTYELQKQEREANALIQHLAGRIGTPQDRQLYGYYDETVRDATTLYLLSRHFPARARDLPPKALEALAAPLGRGEYTTLSSAMLVLAFDAYAASLPTNQVGKFTATQSNAAGKELPLELHGALIRRGDYQGDSVKLHLVNDSGVTGFYSITSAGYDETPPAGALAQGLELVRDYLDAAGQPVTAVRTGDEVTVRLRMRAIDRNVIGNVAVTDLLPGGFEPVLASAAAPDAAAGGWKPDFVDSRDDRVVLYGTVSKDLAQYSYRMRATNAGVFLVPGAFAESMYDRRLRARAAAGRLTVTRPQAP